MSKVKIKNIECILHLFDPCTYLQVKFMSLCQTYLQNMKAIMYEHTRMCDERISINESRRVDFTCVRIVVHSY